MTVISRLLIKAAGKTELWSAPKQWLVALTSLALVLALDAVTGAQVTLVVFYLLVAGLAAWTMGEPKGLLFAVLVALGGATVRHFQYAADPLHAAPLVTQAWNSLARLLAASMVVALVGGMHSALRLERWRASTDGLTGVLNKASFNQQMSAALRAARGMDRAFILAYMDLDGFKLVNDRHGHSAGDEILQIFAQGAVDAIRDHDLFARIGGDEFVALMSIPDVGDGDHIAFLVHQRLTNILARTGLPVRCSMGAVVATASQLEPIEAAIQLADKLMYEVKRAGRNALRVGRIDAGAALAAPNALEIQSDLAPSSQRDARSAVMSVDRRAA